MGEVKRENLLKRGWRNVREAGTNRLALTGILVLLALLVARYSWDLPEEIVPDSLRVEGTEGTDLKTPGTGDAERALYDLRSAQLSQTVAEQDDRVTLVVFDDQTLIKARKRSPLDRGLLAKALRNLDTMGAKAIGIDILFDQPQDEDAELITALRSMETPTMVAYADIATNASDIGYEQQEYLRAFLAQLEGSKAQPASIRLDNSYGVTRKWPKIEPGLPPLLGRAMLQAAGEGDKAFPGYEGSIRYRKAGFENLPMYSTIQIDNYVDDELLAIPEFAEMISAQITGRYILIGGDIIDYDRVQTTLSSVTGENPAGLRVHADLVTQMLDGDRRGKVAGISLWAFAFLVVATAVLTGLLEWGSWRVYVLLAAQFGLFLGVPFVLEARGVDTFGVPAAGWLLGWIVAFTAITSAARASSAVQRTFAQGALGKYLPKEMAAEIIENPKLLALHGVKREIYVLFSDLEGFTKMSHAQEPEMVAKLLNRYLDLLSEVVLDHGGVIDKFVGDAVVAFWGAPIAKPDDGERAARAGYAIWQAGEAFREEVAAMDAALPKIGKTRVGLHYGEAVVGNFGGETRIQYTALGDSMNTAARLEAANKALDSSVMASSEFAERSGMDWWRAMGRVRLRGRAQAVEIMEPAPDFPREDAALLSQAHNLANEDAAKAVLIIQDLVARYPADKALANLLHRLNNLGEGGTYVLG
ncbi:adenylate/guanylate cyclase domain-containing protein [Qipengyuania marisflavi]|uniref:Adenylate/guanylate cyclase domain-containing protein n=1 Tax=Qipengyuania marisflavi TaxID=2486356 RepID=A0A5S3P2T6_9SPHN|nr:adenylate/guanylate cyclase domain-containing protein [Qipengyuania marisflavi]TMM47294.1 adenylate/guanylate cyclase domain-containing protein [Qipengyuania marisflavi]